MDVDQVMKAARGAMTVRRVFGDPVERDGVTLVPAAVVRGGMGGGGGRQHGRDDDALGEVAEGEGGGFGVAAAPVGAYSIRDGRVRWHPSVNVNLLATLAAAVTITWLITRRPRALRGPRP